MTEGDAERRKDDQRVVSDEPCGRRDLRLMCAECSVEKTTNGVGVAGHCIQRICCPPRGSHEKKRGALDHTPAWWQKPYPSQCVSVLFVPDTDKQSLLPRTVSAPLMGRFWGEVGPPACTMLNRLATNCTSTAVVVMPRTLWFLSSTRAATARGLKLEPIVISILKL